MVILTKNTEFKGKEKLKEEVNIFMKERLLMIKFKEKGKLFGRRGVSMKESLSGGIAWVRQIF